MAIMLIIESEPTIGTDDGSYPFHPLPSFRLTSYRTPRSSVMVRRASIV